MDQYLNDSNILKECSNDPCQLCKQDKLTVFCDRCGICVCTSKSCSVVLNYKFNILTFCSECKPYCRKIKPKKNSFISQ